MVSETVFPERRAALRAISRPSQLAFAVALLAVVSGCVTYALLTGLTNYTLDQTGLMILGLVNLTLVLSLAALIGWRLTRLWATRRSGRAGARLHTRLVAWFSAIAVVPAIVVAVFASVTLNIGMTAWFSSNVRTALDGSVNISRQYVKEQFARIIIDAAEIADGIQLDRSLRDNHGSIDLGRMFTKLELMTRDRGLAGSFIVDSRGNVQGSSSKLKYTAALVPSAADLADALHGHPVAGADSKTGLVRALIHLDSMKDAYLLIVRVVDPAAFTYYQRNKGAVSEYHELEHNRFRLQLIFALLYGMVTLVVLLAAIWSGLWAANRLVRPISGLIDAAGRVSEGDLSAQVLVERDDDELGTLGMAFNRMTEQLTAQRSDLVAANRLNEVRRRFTETVLSGVSAGVIGIDHEGSVTIVNRAAARLLDAAPEDMEGGHYSDILPELAPLVLRAMSEPAGRAGGEVIIKRGGSPRTLSVQVTSERGSAEGFVATFDDITDLVGAQRTAAWADVARRIAHEIKNPLTPIQLSAERLKRKYAHEIVTDPEVFQQCTDTIVRQVGDIGRMVDEFSSFARMPTPVMRRENAQELLQQALFLQRVANPQITFTTAGSKDTLFFEGDGRLVSQALTNVLKNAGEGIAARIARGDDEPGRINIAVVPDGATFAYKVTDNGVGLPPEHKHRLTEPYVTTRAKGTGLGLAIVRKIMEDHGGDITLADAEGGEGAEVTLTFPFTQKRPMGEARDSKAQDNKGSEDEQERIADRV
ncbi:MAG TPA: PAS domain-containing sensor histidine kinase [Rhizomicrobium sp.]|jgi:two-component system nitrogen regulation sensor histidine kinase NtrY|nr:PAS domain-containing sensor histidine kinase [Rhizomicrobium sp.]